MSRRRLQLILALMIAAVTSCSDRADQPSRAGEAEVTAMCEQVRTIQNDVVEAANAMAMVEVSAEPGERAIILADGLDAMIDVVRHAELPSAPVELVGGIRERREEVVRDADIEADEFRMNWLLVEAEDRAAAVQFVFVVGEKLMSEVEPRTIGDTPSELIEIARGVPACQFVIQLPRTAE